MIEKILQKLFQTKSIPGMITRAEGELLFYLTTFSEGKGDILEIGSWLGRSSTYLAKGCKISGRGKLHYIDTLY